MNTLPLFFNVGVISCKPPSPDRVDSLQKIIKEKEVAAPFSLIYFPLNNIVLVVDRKRPHIRAKRILQHFQLQVENGRVAGSGHGYVKCILELRIRNGNLSRVVLFRKLVADDTVEHDFERFAEGVGSNLQRFGGRIRRHSVVSSEFLAVGEIAAEESEVLAGDRILAGRCRTRRKCNLVAQGTVDVQLVYAGQISDRCFRQSGRIGRDGQRIDEHDAGGAFHQIIAGKHRQRFVIEHRILKRQLRFAVTGKSNELGVAAAPAGIDRFAGCLEPACFQRS